MLLRPQRRLCCSHFVGHPPDFANVLRLEKRGKGEGGMHSRRRRIERFCEILQNSQGSCILAIFKVEAMRLIKLLMKIAKVSIDPIHTVRVRFEGVRGDCSCTLK
jgi:hypothetical protein